MDTTIEFLHILSKSKKSPEEVHEKIIEHVKSTLGNKKLILKKINPETFWGREHCEYCFKDLEKNEEVYTDLSERYFLCKSCFEKHREELNLNC